MEAIGAWAAIQWKDDNQRLEPCYFSFGEWDEENNTDTYGVNDERIFFYADGAGSMQALMDWANGEDFVVLSYELEYSY